MNGFKKMSLALATAGLLTSGMAQATLFDRGGGLLYDDVLNVTWLQDANYAKTSGYDADGLMNWTAANTWAANLVYGGYDDWRLAANTPVGADWNEAQSLDGSTDWGYNITSPHNELSYMYYVNLGLKGLYSTAGVYQPDYGVFGDGKHGTGPYGGQNDVGLVKNLQSYNYWSGTAYPLSPTDYARGFNTIVGLQDKYTQVNVFSVWAVRPGDVAAPIPEPESYAILMAGLGLVGFMVRRKKSA